MCEMRGEVIITGLTNAPIPWPIAKRPKERARALVIYGDLLAALKRESATAVAYWWGVTPQTITKWRKDLGICTLTEGTIRLKSQSAKDSPGVEAGRKKAVAKATDPERCRKIAAARRGKPRPKHVIEAMRAGRTGKPHPEEVRARMSEAHKRRGTRPPKAGRPWTKEEDKLLWSLSAAEVARQTSRTLTAVYTRRHLLGLPDGRRR
jgi:hypothetical protein